MVVASNPNPIRVEKIREMEIPIIDLKGERLEVAKLIVKACEEFGFFKIINHGVPEYVIRRMEDESYGFFGKPGPEKQRAGPPTPYGYGSKNIGFNGDTGEVEYLILSTNPSNISQRSKSISNDPSKFSSAVNGYVEAVRGLACEILELIAEGLWVPDTSVFSRLIRDVESDSLIRLNHYPPIMDGDTSPSPSSFPPHHQQQQKRIGFGEHSDPQILTILRSNGVGGLQISLEDGVWVPISPDPTAFCINVGDVLQRLQGRGGEGYWIDDVMEADHFLRTLEAMTNGRFVSVRHRAMVNSYESRMSMAYFGAPPLQAKISCPPELVPSNKQNLYRPFTWAEYKKTSYTLRLGDGRLNLFKVLERDESN